jgi:hypothetical protein
MPTGTGFSLQGKDAVQRTVGGASKEQNPRNRHSIERARREICVPRAFSTDQEGASGRSTACLGEAVKSLRTRAYGRDHRSLRKTGLIPTSQHPPPNKWLCQNTHYSFATDLWSRMPRPHRARGSPGPVVNARFLACAGTRSTACRGRAGRESSRRPEPSSRRCTIHRRSSFRCSPWERTG